MVCGRQRLEDLNKAMRYRGPRNRIARREKMDLGLKTAGSKAQAVLIKRIDVPPGQHSSRRRRQTEHGRQLREKQKLRFIFGLTETKLKAYFKKAVKKKGNTAHYLSELLEKRLDRVVYLLGMAPTIASARQLVNHGHILVNKELVTIPSYQVKEGDLITFKNSKTAEIPYIKDILADKERTLPAWLKRKGTVGKVLGGQGSILIDNQVTLRDVIEFYSK